MQVILPAFCVFIDNIILYNNGLKNIQNKYILKKINFEKHKEFSNLFIQ